MELGSRGSALAQALIAALVGVGVTYIVSKVSIQTVSVGRRAADQHVLHEFQSDFVRSNKNVEALLKVWRDPSMNALTGEIASCLPETAKPVCQGAENIADEVVKKKAAGLIVHSVRLSDAVKNGSQAGTLVAGTESAPLYFKGDGSICSGGVKDPQCRFRGIAYMIRQGLNDPGNVQFMVKYERNPATKLANESVLAPIYALLDIGTRWRSPSASAICAGISGFDASGDPLCYPYPNCGPGEHFMGWDSLGVPHCVADLQPNCAPGEGVTGFDGTGLRVCKAIKNDGQWSGCTATCGGGVATSCSYPFPNPAIPNDGACSRAAPSCNTGPCSCSHTGLDCWTAWSACSAGMCEKTGQNTRRCQATPPMTCVDPANQGTLSTRTNRRTGVTTLQESKPCDFSSTNRWTGQNRSFPIIWAASPCGFDRWYDVSGCSYSVGGVPTWPWPGSPPGSPSFSADQCRYGSFPRGSLHIFGPGAFITGGAVPNSP